MKDKRKDPRPRKRPDTWQYYLWYWDCLQVRKKHLQRLSSIKEGKSNLRADIEILELAESNIDQQIERYDKLMVDAAEREFGKVYEWINTIKGLGTGHLSAQILTHTDDISRFQYVSKYWRFFGLAVIDGKAERFTSHFSRDAKALMLGDKLVADQMLMHNTPPYREEYDRYRLHLDIEFPLALCKVCGAEGKQRNTARREWYCPEGCSLDKDYTIQHTPNHKHKMAKRVISKLLLQHLWVVWRDVEGLPITEPWILREGTGHSHYIPPPNYP